MKVLIADDHALFREALHITLCQIDPRVEVFEAQDWNVAHAMCQLHPDLSLALVDLNMPGMTARAGLGSFVQSADTIPVIVISASENLQDMHYAFNAGAAGFICKNESTPVILGAIRLVLSGGVYIPKIYAQQQSEFNSGSKLKLSNELTPRQLEVLKELCTGKSNKEIAIELDLSVVTVKIHISSIFKALQVNSRLQAVQRAQEMGLC